MLLGTRHRLRLALIGLAGFGVEVLGVHAGLPFGVYTYTAALAPRLFGVPMVLGCAWLVLVAYVTDRMPRVIASAPGRVALGALWLVGIDLLIDPLAAGTLNYWRWAECGRYYGVPLSNFAGWFATGAMLVALLPGKGTIADGTVGWTGLSIIVFFGLIAAAHGLTVPALVSVALVGVHFVAQHFSSV
jgi:putative membrane protein